MTTTPSRCSVRKGTLTELGREGRSTDADAGPRRAEVPPMGRRSYEPRVSPIIGLGRTGSGGGDGGGDGGLVAMVTFYDWFISTMTHAITSAMSRSAPARNATISQRSWPRFNDALRPM